MDIVATEGGEFFVAGTGHGDPAVFFRGGTDDVRPMYVVGKFQMPGEIADAAWTALTGHLPVHETAGGAG
jgi:hypothetical protein